MKLLGQIFYIIGVELRFFRRYPRLIAATLAVACIPAVYAVIYLSSVWDPMANTQLLPVGLVNLDRGVNYRDQMFNVGEEVTSKIRARHTFGYQVFHDEAQVRQQIVQGKLAFALIIPADFSSNALPAAEAGAGKLVVYTSEGNSFQSAGMARRFAQDLGHEVNESLNERRWALVLNNVVGSQRSLDRLREGVAQLRVGAVELGRGTAQVATGAQGLQSGAEKLHGGVEQLTGGMRQLGAGLRTLDANRVSGADLTRLKTGADSLVSGHAELGHGLSELQDGSDVLLNKIKAFRDEAKSSAFVGDRVKDGLDQLGGGVSQLNSGLEAANAGQQKLADGAQRLSAGVGTLTNGMRAMNNGVRTMVNKLPEDAQLEALNEGAVRLNAKLGTLVDGTKRLELGANQLTEGVDLLIEMMPLSVQKVDGSAKGLANSVSPAIEIEAPVQNNGSGFSPNILPGALWLGASIAVFLIHVRILPRRAREFSPPARIMGKLVIPSVVVLMQALLIFVSVLYVLKMRVLNPSAFALTLATTSLAFLLIVFALGRAFGDAGKAIALILLAVQLSSSGGMLPVELSGGVFADISPWLPLTWVVRALKANMFGAYGGDWQHPLQWVAWSGLVAVTIATFFGRWRYVKQSAYRPAIEF